MDFKAFDRGLTRAWRGRGSGLVVLRSPASTQALARRLVKEYTREGVPTPGVDIVAWQQLAGQGRRGGHPWSSPAGLGVYLTLVRPLRPGPYLQLLPLVASITLCELLTETTGARCGIKWPNDLMAGGCKLGGLLTELTSRGDQETILSLGLGLNHGGEAVDYQAPAATTLHQLAERAEGETTLPELPELAHRVVDALDRALEALPSSDPAEVVARYREWAIHRPGDHLRCRQGERELEGRFEGFDENGFLRLRVGEQIRRVSSGIVLGDVAETADPGDAESSASRA